MIDLKRMGAGRRLLSQVTLLSKCALFFIGFTEMPDSALIGAFFYKYGCHARKSTSVIE